MTLDYELKNIKTYTENIHKWMVRIKFVQSTIDNFCLNDKRFLVKNVLRENMNIKHVQHTFCKSILCFNIKYLIAVHQPCKHIFNETMYP